MKTLLPMLGAALALGFASSALAQTSNEALYSRYHQAIETARLCLDATFDQGDIDRMAAVINDKIDHDIGAKRLNLMRQAQQDAKALVQAKGCEAPDVQDLLGLYERDLAPVVD